MGGSTTTTAELVRGAFFKMRSVKIRDGHGRNNSAVEKKGWSSVKSYLCGDQCNSALGEKDSASFRQLEFSSVIAEENSACATLSQFRPDFTEEEEDAASIKSSEATVTQPVAGEGAPDKGISTESISNSEQTWKEKQTSTYRLFQQEDAAITIQSAFRSYQARHSRGVTGFGDGKQEHLEEAAIQSPESLSSSIKVHTGDSNRRSSVDAERIDLQQQMRKRVRVQVAKLQEEWDDSTVSSTISKMRIQNRIEAATRRERALAYAFAQQLRVCAKKKRTKMNGLDTNMSRSWLERWMATRQPENSFFSNNVNKTFESHRCNDQPPISRNRLVESTVEEESCGSNEISIQIDGSPVSRIRAKDYLRPAPRKGKAMRNIYRRQSVQSTQHLKEPKVNKNGCHAEDEKGNKGKPKQKENEKDIEHHDFVKSNS